MEPMLMVIGLDHRSAPLAMRERFWIGENRRYEVLQKLKRAEGIEEAVVLSTCCRTEFLLWADEPTLAANSVLQFLGHEYGLKLSEWQHFYRLLDEPALTHVFRVTAGLDSVALGEPEIVPQIKGAWEQARTVAASGRFLNAILDKALNVSERVRRDTEIEKLSVSIPSAASDLARQIFGPLDGRRILLLGTGKMNELAARQMIELKAGPVTVIDQSLARAHELAKELGGSAAPLSERWKCIVQADIVISATACPHVILTREEAERIATERNRVALVIMDVGVPRDVDPDVRRVDGILLYDLESLQRAAKSQAVEPTCAMAAAEFIITTEVQAFRGTLQAESRTPITLALRGRLEEICREELESFTEERGPFTAEQNQVLHSITSQVLQRIATYLAHGLKELPERAEQEQMTAAVNRLFHLEPQTSDAGSKSQHDKSDRNKVRPVAINY